MFGFITEIYRRLKTPSTRSIAERVDAIVEQRRTKTRYALGSPNSRGTLNCVSGPETEVFLESRGRLTQYGFIQGVSFENVIEDGARVVRGTFVALVGDRTHFVIGDKFKRLVLQWQSEHGRHAYLEVLDVEIVKVGTGVSIDDITTDVVYTFAARGEVSWRKDKCVRREVRCVIVSMED